jgi:predicted metal-dependent hydrolase
VRVFKYVTVVFLYELTRQTLLNLWHDGSLLRWSTWTSGARMLLGKQGLFRGNYQAWKAYMAEDFHPRHQDDALSRAWLRDHSDQFVPVGQRA